MRILNRSFIIKNLFINNCKELFILRKYYFVQLLSPIIISFFILNLFMIDDLWGTPEINKINVYEMTTRGNLDEIQNGDGIGYKDRYPLLNINELYNSCPDEIAIIVHGWSVDKNNAKERFDRVKMSLEHNNYYIPIIGFSWDSNIDWSDAKKMAKNNGPKLANFILELTDDCKQQPHNKEIKIRLIGHSLGSRVILSALDSINEKLPSDDNYKIESVHLIGAAVDNEEISKNYGDYLFDTTNWYNWETVKDVYGGAIEERVIKFYNLYNPNDDILELRGYPQIYPSFEFDSALGQSGYQIFPYSIYYSLPENYDEVNVQKEILPICDSDGDSNPDFWYQEGMTIYRGDNHGGYFGFRNGYDTTTLTSDGAMNILVDQWNNVGPTIDQNARLSSICK